MVTELEIDHQTQNDFLITNFDDPINAIIQSTYPYLMDQYNNVQFLQSRAILASTIGIADQINDYVLLLLPGDEREYPSSDSIDKSETIESQIFEGLTSEFLNSLRTSNLPNHKIKLKVGTPIMLLRNLDQFEGLSNHEIEARVMSENTIGNIIYIPRMSISPSQSSRPFKLIQRQFPIMVSYDMTINKSQGQSLESVGLYLTRPVFIVMVNFSRVKSKRGLKILIHDRDNKPLKTTTNVVFKEVFQNL
uniref:DNA helicase Pif1-like 2B domain-containing protein n=1 Tax=Glycine max TaxID=3847 RepID=A0A0R0KHC7_SOYBN